ncbi:MAG TPA: ATP-NAD kinase family protein [Candidatus Thermoplasmatota archaeon]|nr:ATP-NAD kinase family protein [Candidatus Thermoplasmatota archaeon]
MALRVGFVVNPIAGMGGRVGLKGTDAMAAEAHARGAAPVAPERARRFLHRLAELLAAGALAEPPQWLAAGQAMGADLLRTAEVGTVEVVHEPRPTTSADDTRAAVRGALARGAEVLVFAGGDGTARDVADAADGKAALLGIPSGVKMHSAVFALTPEAAAVLLAEHAQGLARVVEAELLDVDEEAYRRGEWHVKLYGLAPTLDEPTLRQLGKMSFEEVDEASQHEELAEHVAALARERPARLLLLGPGATLAAIKAKLGLRPTLLGFDAWLAGQQVGADLDERAMLALLERGADALLVVSPIGAQGFVLGRGNQQASAQVVRGVGVRNLLVVATPAKLRATPALHVDTGDLALDEELRARGHWPVVVGLRTSRMVPVARA